LRLSDEIIVDFDARDDVLGIEFLAGSFPLGRFRHLRAGRMHDRAWNE